MQRFPAKSHFFAFAAGLSVLAAGPIAATAQQQVRIPQNTISNANYPNVVLPLVICWNNGKKNLYIQTESSDQTMAKQQGLNYVPQLADAIDAPGGATDDLYAITNSTQPDQYNVLPSEPFPVGPENTNQAYSPLWQVSQVTWKTGVAQTTLKSEDDVLNAEKAGKVTIAKTRIIVNCPVIYTAPGGLLPNTIVLELKTDRSGIEVYRNK